MADTTAPIITVLNKNSLEKVTSESLSVFVSIKGGYSLTTIYTLLNNSKIIQPSNVTTDSIYEFRLQLNYGQNSTKIIAKSNNNNDSTFYSLLIFRSPITECIKNLNPLPGTTNIENKNGISLKWTSPTIDKNVLLSYKVHIKNDNQQQLTAGDSVLFTSLKGSTHYYWWLEMITKYDTTRCPSDTNAFYDFYTIDHPSTITGLIDITCFEGRKIKLAFDAKDDEGIKEYALDYNGDAIIDTEFSESSFIFTAPLPGTYNSTLKVKDSSDNLSSFKFTIEVKPNTSPYFEKYSYY
jgi:hypothetical protein